jgi:error-prone DNA polymerase
MQEEDEQVFDMICAADTIGVFQIESRAQMSMLPRLRPREFYDIVIQVAIVRPGPIQGNMVHPYLRRREGKEPELYPSEALRHVLQKTKGVPLFQEQAMKVAIVGAGFTAGQADALRRSMATFKATGGVSKFREPMIEGMLKRGYERGFAERTFKQIEGFGSYGFPESHAASFAKIAYASSWMKCHHPDIFCAALLNAQPMGFYQPAQLVRDAQEHGVEVRPVCINSSRWDCTLEEGEELLPLRLGLRMVRGLSNVHAAKILAVRGDGPFGGIEDVWLRSDVPVAALEKLADADSFACFGLDRRQALWQVRGLGAAPLPLFAAADAREEGREPAVALAPLGEGREVFEDYRTVQLSLRAHPLSFLRGELDRRGITSCADLARVKNGDRVNVAGIVLIRQRPGQGNVTFITIEDETGIANAILWQRCFEAHRRIVMTSAMIGVRGIVQREGQVIHVVADGIADQTALLRSVGDMAFPHRPGPGDGVTHPGSPDRGEKGWKPNRVENTLHQKTRDFH